MIPKNIHLVYINEHKEIPEIFKKTYDRIKSFHPSWNITLYDDNDARQILTEHLPYLLPTYNKLNHKIQQADFIRLVLVYLYGGFYMDLDMYCLKPLDDLAKYKVVLGEEKMMSIEDRNRLGLKHELRVANYMFGGQPKQDYYLKLIEKFVQQADEPIYNQEDILEITGPGMFTNFYHDNKDKYPEVLLLRNFHLKCMQPYHNEIACHFGDYAAHLHMGTWRRDIPA